MAPRSTQQSKAVVPGGLNRLKQNSRRLSLKLTRSARCSQADQQEALRLGALCVEHDACEQAIALYEAACRCAPDNHQLWFGLGLAYRSDQRLDEADAALERAQELAPTAPTIAFARAQVRFETGRPATPFYEIARRLGQDDLEFVRCFAAARAAEGDAADAQSRLETALAAHPDWLEGHRALSALRWTSGDVDGFDMGYAAACALRPRQLPLRLAWFYALAAARLWTRARNVLDEGERAIGPTRGFMLARAYLVSESDAPAQAYTLFEALSDVDDPGFDLCRVRHSLRHGEIERAQAIAWSRTGGPAAGLFWPYLSICWRLLDDDRASWLDGDPPRVSIFRLPFSAGELDSLAVALRAQHTLRSPYAEQSVRGGTQTDRQLFFRRDPDIQLLRRRAAEAVGDYIATLPRRDAAHPLLAPARERVRFEGSWSVRLRGGGFHTAHTHPKSWISSAFYVDAPSADELGPRPAGCLEFGTPPSDLGLALKPYLTVAPEPGQLVLFPSTLWHRTVPFQRGERLTAAFDVRAFQT